ncbi:MAG: hypothetical protein KDE14_06420 [Rhodobacteraceae bacterium]|nr:hypothetical protein [Paracoccaceae bacterium]
MGEIMRLFSAEDHEEGRTRWTAPLPMFHLNQMTGTNGFVEAKAAIPVLVKCQDSLHRRGRQKIFIYQYIRSFASSKVKRIAVSRRQDSLHFGSISVPNLI